MSQGTISLIERGRVEGMSVRTLSRVADALDGEFVGLLRWRGGDLDRLVDEGHARVLGAVAASLTKAGWLVRPEVSYAVYGERGSIDLLAFHPRAQMLLVIEVKTELVSVEETLRKHDEKVRLGPRIASERFGWQATGASRLLVFPAVSTARRRVERQAPALASGYPARGAMVRQWLRAPVGHLAGIQFVDVTGAGGGSALTRKRIHAKGLATSRRA